MATNDKNVTNSFDLTEFEKETINSFLLNNLYEKELKSERPTAEVESITNGVKYIVKELMTAVGEKEPLLEISQQHLVGSMAEDTSIGAPDEYDFLVVLRKFSHPVTISTHFLLSDLKVTIINENISLDTLRKSDCVLVVEDRRLLFKDLFLSNILNDIMSAKSKPLCVETDYGKLTIKSPTVCHHGPASVVKLIWEPKSASSKPLDFLDILIDITPCIEQKKCIHTVIGSKIVIPDQYTSHISKDDTFMLIPNFFSGFDASISTTEAEIVDSLLPHHKTCYMILKYCFNNVVHKLINSYITLFSSYVFKQFILRHVKGCESAEKGHQDKKTCLIICLLDIMDDLKDNVSKTDVDGIFDTFEMPYHIHWSKEIMTQVIDTVIQRLVHIGKDGFSVDRYEDFKKACHRTSTHRAIHKRADKLAHDEVECHLSLTCRIHPNNYLPKVLGKAGWHPVHDWSA